MSREGRERVLREALRTVRDQYDFILIDCPPSLGLITLNVLAAADAVLIPMQCEYYALEGISQLLNTVHVVQQNFNPSLAIDGVLLTMYDARLNLCRQVANDAREYFGDKVFTTVIPRNVRLAEAPSFGMPVLAYDVQSIGAKSYLGAAQELLARRRTARTLGGNWMTETKRLGRGLEALSSISRGVPRPGASASSRSRDRPNPFQPRRELDPSALNDSPPRLSLGPAQPVLVRPTGASTNDRGERRWRAVQQLGWKVIPAVVREVDDRALLTSPDREPAAG